MKRIEIMMSSVSRLKGVVIEFPGIGQNAYNFQYIFGSAFDFY